MICWKKCVCWATGQPKERRSRRYLLHDDVRWTRFELSVCVSTQRPCWCGANPCDLHLKPPHSQYECGKSAFVIIGNSFFSPPTVKPAVGMLWRLTDKCIWWMKSFLQGSDVITSNFTPFCSNKMEQQFLLLGSWLTLQGLFFGCRRCSRFNFYCPTRLPNTASYNWFFVGLLQKWNVSPRPAVFHNFKQIIFKESDTISLANFLRVLGMSSVRISWWATSDKWHF